jgi:uncharacterized protein DUF5658
MPPHERRIYDLFVLNVALQIFDAVATYQGIRVGWQEANPILVSAFHLLGVGPALMLFKAKACGLLFLLNRRREHYMVAPTLSLLAGVYCVMSLLPWMGKFFGLLVQTI